MGLDRNDMFQEYTDDDNVTHSVADQQAAYDAQEYGYLGGKSGPKEMIC